MIKYEDKNSDKVLSTLVDYIYLKKFDKELIGSFLFPYYSESKNFDIIQFYFEDSDNVNDSKKPIKGEIWIGENRIQFVDMDLSYIFKYADEIASCEILYDPYGMLHSIKAIAKQKKFETASNQFTFNTSFMSKFETSSLMKSSKSGVEEYLEIYYSLVDYYFNCIVAFSNFNYKNFEDFMMNVLQQSGLIVFKDDMNLHTSALMEAICKAEQVTNDKNKQKRLGE